MAKMALWHDKSTHFIEYKSMDLVFINGHFNDGDPDMKSIQGHWMLSKSFSYLEN